MILNKRSKNPFSRLHPTGKSLEEITGRLGTPWKTDEKPEYTLRIWRQGKCGQYYIILVFKNDKCLSIFDEGEVSTTA